MRIMRYYQQILHIQYTDHVTNEEVRQIITQVDSTHWSACLQ